MSALREELINVIKERTHDWSDFNESDLGMILLELLVGTYDMLGFYLDKQALENYIDTVKQRKNAKSIASIVNYKSKMIKSCVASMTCVLSKNIDKSIKIPRYTQVNIKSKNVDNSTYASRVDSDIVYVTKDDFTLYPQDVNNGSKFEIPIIQGKVVNYDYDISNLGDSLAIIYLDDIDIAEGSVVVSIDGDEWEEVDDVLLDDISGKKFSVHEDRLDRTYIILHPSYPKYIPIDVTIPMKITYLETLGTRGKINSNSVHSITSNIVVKDDIMLDQILTATNDLPSSNGADKESLELIAKRAKNQAKTLGFAVILEDYAMIVESISGIYKAIAIDWKTEDSKYIKVPYKVDVYAVPESGFLLEKSDLDLANDILSKKCVSTIVTNVMTVPYVEVDLDIKIYSDINPDKYAELKFEVDSYIRKQYDPRVQQFGAGLKYSTLLNHIHNSSKFIEYAELRNIHKNINVKYYEMIYIRNIDIDISRGE